MGTRGGWMKTGTCRACAHSQNAKVASPSRNWPCQLDVISSPLNPSGPRHRSPSAMWLASSGLSVPRPQLLFARATTAAVWSLMNFTTSIAGFCEIAVITSAANGLLMTRPGLGADILLQLKIGHVVIGDCRQATIIRHRVFADRYTSQRRGNAKRIIARARCTMGMDIDDGHQMLSTRP